MNNANIEEKKLSTFAQFYKKHYFCITISYDNESLSKQFRI